jgi:hypothetical protein
VDLVPVAAEHQRGDGLVGLEGVLVVTPDLSRPPRQVEVLLVRVGVHQAGEGGVPRFDHDQAPTGPQRPLGLGQEGQRVAQMVEHVGAHEVVHGGVAHR